MRIALFSECYMPVTNGVVTSVSTLRRTLRERGHTVFVFAPGAPQPDDDDDIYRLPALPFPRHPYHFARPFPRIPVDFGSLDVEIVHCQHPFTVGRLGAETARKHNLPMVYTVHSLYDNMMASSKSPVMRRMGQPAARGVMRRFCARADIVIVPSQHTYDALRTDRVVARLVVVPSGVEPLPVHCDGRARIRQQLGLTDTMPLLLYVGRLGPEKRVELLLHAVASLKTRLLPDAAADFRLAIVGDGQCRADLELLAAELDVMDRVYFVGAQPHEAVGDWYAAGDIFTLSSPAETQGLALIEAMNAGLPCIAVAMGGPREVVLHEQTGLLVPLDAESFADAIAALLRDPQKRRKFAERGRVRARDYTPAMMTDGILAVYREALNLVPLTASA